MGFSCVVGRPYVPNNSSPESQLSLSPAPTQQRTAQLRDSLSEYFPSGILARLLNLKFSIECT